MRFYICPIRKSSLCCWPQGRIVVLHTRLSMTKTGEFVDRDIYQESMGARYAQRVDSIVESWPVLVVRFCILV